MQDAERLDPISGDKFTGQAWAEVECIGFAMEVCGYEFCLFFSVSLGIGKSPLHAWREPIAEHCFGVTNRPCVSELSVTSTCLHLTLKKCKASLSFLKPFRSVLIDTMQ